MASDTRTGGVEHPKAPEKIRQSDEYLAVLRNGFKQTHIVRTETFDNSFALDTYDSEAYDGHIASIGDAESLCGRELRGRMLPEDTVDRDGEVCDNCLASLNKSIHTTSTEVDRGEGPRTDGGKPADVVERSPNEKGERNEREAANIIGRVRGSGGVEKVDAYSNTDPFGIADVIALGDGKVLLVQVKTNRFTAKDRRKYRRRMHRVDFDHARFEVWVRIDYEGWRMHRYDPETGGFEQYIEMDTCDEEATVEAYREAVGYYDDKQTTGVERSQGDDR